MLRNRSGEQTEAKLPKVQKAFVATPKRRRMANVLDAVLETTKALSPPPTKKIAEAAKAQAESETRQAEAEAMKAQDEAEAGPSGWTSCKIDIAHPILFISSKHDKSSSFLIPPVYQKACCLAN